MEKFYNDFIVINLYHEFSYEWYLNRNLYFGENFKYLVKPKKYETSKETS